MKTDYITNQEPWPMKAKDGPTHRQQFDGLGDQASADSAISFVGAEDVTRQEFMRETDVAYILQRYGLPRSDGQFGEQFATTDLQEAIRLQKELQESWQRLPEALRAQYGSWGQVIAAADRGELTRDDLVAVDQEQERAVTPPSDTEPKG